MKRAALHALKCHASTPASGQPNDPMTTAHDVWRPDRALEIVAGTPPGAGLDRTARALAQAIESRGLVEVPVKVLNLPGDASRRIWAYLDRFAHDAHVVVVTSPNVTTDFLTGQTAFDHDAYTPLATLHNEYIAFVARAGSSIGTSRDLMDHLARDAGSLTTAVATSVGNPNHIALARVTRHVGGEVKALKVRAFDSARDAIADVVAGGCEIAAISATSALPELADGRLRALAVTAPARLAAPFAEVPTWVEHGVDCVVNAWRGIDGARGLDAAQIAFWDSLLADATASDAWRAAIAQHHWSALYRNSSQLAAYLPRERADMRATLEELGLLS
jgi:putative tricarboxylic transport membrane protein